MTDVVAREELRGVALYEAAKGMNPEKVTVIMGKNPLLGKNPLPRTARTSRKELLRAGRPNRQQAVRHTQTYTNG